MNELVLTCNEDLWAALYSDVSGETIVWTELDPGQIVLNTVTPTSKDNLWVFESIVYSSLDGPIIGTVHARAAYPPPNDPMYIMAGHSASWKPNSITVGNDKLEEYMNSTYIAHRVVEALKELAEIKYEVMKNDH
jgi:hypothetical protein